jgi:hypothetical protein
MIYDAQLSAQVRFISIIEKHKSARKSHVNERNVSSLSGFHNFIVSFAHSVGSCSSLLLIPRAPIYLSLQRILVDEKHAQEQTFAHTERTSRHKNYE